MLRGSSNIQPLNSLPTTSPTLNPGLANSTHHVQEEESLLYRRRYIWAPIVGVLLGLIFLYVAGWAVYVTLRRLHVIRHPRPTNFEPFKEPKAHQSSRRIRRVLTGAMGKSKSWGFSYSTSDMSSTETKMKAPSKQRGKPRSSPTRPTESKESSPSAFASRGVRLLMSSPKNKQRKNHHKPRGRYRGRTTSEHNMRMRELNEMARMGRSSSHDSYENDDELDHSSESEHDYDSSASDGDNSLDGSSAHSSKKIYRQFGGDSIVATHSLRESDLRRSINASTSPDVRDVDPDDAVGGDEQPAAVNDESKTRAARLSSRRFMSESSSSSISIKLSEGDFVDDDVILSPRDDQVKSTSSKAHSEEAVLEWNTIYSTEDTVVDQTSLSKRPSKTTPIEASSGTGTTFLGFRL